MRRPSTTLAMQTQSQGSFVTVEQSPRAKLRSPLCDSRPVGFSLGTLLPRHDRACILPEEALTRHQLCVGSTGSGKSRFLELQMRMLLREYRNVCLIDPDGDLCEAMLAAVARSRDDLGRAAIYERVHYLEINPERSAFGYDPFRYSGPYSVSSIPYRCWLERRTEDAAKVILTKTQLGSDEFGVQVRLERWLKNLLFAAGVAYDEAGTHLGLRQALVLLNPDHPDHEIVYRIVSPVLPDDIRSDFEKLRATKRALDQERWVESTINRVRSLLSSIVSEVLSRTVETVDFRRIVEEPGQVLLVNLQDTDYFSPDQASAIGGLVIHEILSHTRTRRTRRQVYLVIDECWRFLGESLCRALAGHRKYGVSILLSTQHIGQLKRGELDLTADVLNNCRTIVCFQQSHPDDLDLLARALGYGNLDFSELYQVVDRPDGYDWVEVQEQSTSMSAQQSESHGRGSSDTEGHSEEQSHSHSTQETWSTSESHESGTSRSSTASHSEGVTSGTSRGETPLIVGDQVRQMLPLTSRQENRSRGVERSDSSGYSEKHGSSKSRGGGQSEQHGTSESRSRSTAHSRSREESGGFGLSQSVSQKKVPLARTREEWHPTGRLRMAAADQFEQMKQQIQSLKTRQAIVRLADSSEAFAMEVHETPEPFASAPYRAYRVAELKRILQELHDYTFVPGDEETNGRLLPALQDADEMPRNGRNGTVPRNGSPFPSG